MVRYQHKRGQRRKEKFLGRTDPLIPWKSRLEDIIEPYHPKAGSGRRRYPRCSVLMAFSGGYSSILQSSALYEIASMRLFFRAVVKQVSTECHLDPVLKVRSEKKSD
jgi:IS5 family transposase